MQSDIKAHKATYNILTVDSNVVFTFTMHYCYVCYAATALAWLLHNNKLDFTKPTRKIKITILKSWLIYTRKRYKLLQQDFAA